MTAQEEMKTEEKRLTETIINELTEYADHFSRSLAKATFAYIVRHEDIPDKECVEMLAILIDTLHDCKELAEITKTLKNQ